MRAIQSYQRTQLESAPGPDILVMLVEAALQREDAALAAMERGDRLAWVQELHVVRAIFLELRMALDHSLLPVVAASLDTTYKWCIHHLTVAGRTADKALLTQVRDVTTTLHETWTQAVGASRAGEDPNWTAS
jgi:flagellar biosynthetic protein FliS